MERIKLSKDEKKVLWLASTGEDCPDTFPIHIFNGCIRSLERKGLVEAAYVEGGDVEAVRLTPEGRLFLAENPELKNSIDWVRIIEFALPLIISIIALFYALKDE